MLEKLNGKEDMVNLRARLRSVAETVSWKTKYDPEIHRILGQQAFEVVKQWRQEERLGVVPPQDLGLVELRG
jgi:hypothetical protein